MDKAHYRAALRLLGLTQSHAALVVGVSPRASRKWANGECDVSGPAARLLMLIAGAGLDVAAAESLIEKGRAAIEAGRQD